MYKTKLQSFDRFNSLTFIGLLIYQAIITYYYQDTTITMVSGYFGNAVFKPFIVPLSGIWLFIHLADMIDKKFKNDKLLSYIGQHTWDIMLHHMFIIRLVNLSFFSLNKYGLLVDSLSQFEINRFVGDIYYRYGLPQTYIIFVLAASLLPLVPKYTADLLKKRKQARNKITVTKAS
ncbi:hypothetical protein CVD19_21800 [Bacillus sp. T33-2]|nr:hypothetical protein CVD19_21800 [Bacillus sp. T33-2]